jgi:hypothetical protein
MHHTGRDATFLADGMETWAVRARAYAMHPPRMVSNDLTRLAATVPGSGWVARARRLWWWAPLAFAAAYLVTLAVQFDHLLAISYLNADAASAPVIGELFGGRGGHSLVILGHLGWFSTLLFELATRWMPLHRQIWEVAPYAMVLGSAALIGWGAWRVAGRWAAAIAVAIMICAGPGTLPLLLVLDDHAPTWFTLALLGAFVVLLERRADALSRARLAALVVIVGVILGANAASDVLLAIAGAVPMVVAVGCAWALYPSGRTARAAAFALAGGFVAIVTGVFVRVLMRHENVISASDVKTKLLAGAETIGTNFKLWWQSIALLGNGNFFGSTIGFSTALALACAGMTVAAVLVVPRIAWDHFNRARASRDSQFPEQEVRLSWCIYWAASLVLLSAAFILSGIPENLESSRYLVGAIYAAAALVPLLGDRGTLTRAAVTVGVTVYAFTGWLALAQHRIAPPVSPNDRLASTVERIAGEEHLSVGYAGYWDAAPVTWASHLRVKVFPVDDCDAGKHLCGFELHLITSWYLPRPGVKTFLLSDPAYPAVASAPTPDLGKPLVVHQIGSVAMYVYPYDIAARLLAL